MVTILARFKVQPGKEAEAEQALREMAGAVEANEPGALAYVFHRSRSDPAEVTVFEVYADDGAFSTHGTSAHMTKLRSAFGSVFDPGSVKIERLERFAGFIRSA
ncbi:MAG: antibiotic biosynthesis monooxygenase [Chloroflexi bacterium]|nr:antibiotic biosynthesis monooxygenase [Chloroflexota bacterium]